MIRTLSASVVLLLLSSYPASALPQRGSSSLGEKVAPEVVARLAGRVEQAAKATGQAGNFLLTEETEVHLDGRPCRYADVPAGAAITLLEVAPDGRTVLKVHFRTRK